MTETARQRHFRLANDAAKRLAAGKTTRPNQTASTFFGHLQAALRASE